MHAQGVKSATLVRNHLPLSLSLKEDISHHHVEITSYYLTLILGGTYFMELPLSKLLCKTPRTFAE